MKLKHKEGEIMPQSYDEAFKIMYGNPNNIEVTTLLVSKILNIEYEDIEGKVELLPLSTPNEVIGEKLSERDVVVRVNTTDRYKLVIEVNVKDRVYKNILDRNLYYLSEIFSKGLKQGKNYGEIVSTYLINLDTYYMADNKKIIDEYEIRNKEGDVYTDKLKILCINIEGCLKIWYNKKYEEERYKKEKDLILLCASMRVKNIKEYKEIINEIETSKKLKEIMKGVTYKMNNDNAMWNRYISREEDEQMIRDGIIAEEKEISFNEGHTKGVKEGLIQKEREMVINMFHKGLSKEDIKEISNLSEEEIEKIIHENGK